MKQQIKKIYLFNLLPLLTVKTTSSSRKIYVLGVRLLTFKKSKLYLLGIPLLGFATPGAFGLAVLRFVINKKKKRNLILIADNILDEKAEPLDSFAFFEYMAGKKDSPFRVCYILNRKNDRYRELCQQYKKQIIAYPDKSLFGWRTLFLFFQTRYILDCGQNLFETNPKISFMLRKSNQIELILTQHGITFFKDNFISPNMYGQNIFDKVMVSNDIERDIFIRRGNYLPENIIYNGLFRWDKLLPVKRSGKKRRIFIYFTYRRYLFRLRNMEDSVYIRTISELINHPGLRQILEKNDVELDIAQHHSISQRNMAILDNVRLVGENDIGSAKKNADLLITDFSSMCFDFLIQDKPVIFLKIPDSEDCLRYNYSQDTADPWRGKEHLGFNPAESADECVALIEKYIEDDFKLSPWQKRLKKTFFRYPSQFCARFYEYLKQNA